MDGWNGSLGYDKDGRTLKIREDEAKTVRLLFNLYAEACGARPG